MLLSKLSGNHGFDIVGIKWKDGVKIMDDLADPSALMKHVDDIDHIVINEAKYSYDGKLRKGRSQAGPQLSPDAVREILRNMKESKDVYLQNLAKLIESKTSPVVKSFHIVDQENIVRTIKAE